MIWIVILLIMHAGYMHIRLNQSTKFFSKVIDVIKEQITSIIKDQETLDQVNTLQAVNLSKSIDTLDNLVDIVQQIVAQTKVDIVDNRKPEIFFKHNIVAELTRRLEKEVDDDKK